VEEYTASNMCTPSPIEMPETKDRRDVQTGNQDTYKPRAGGNYYEWKDEVK
jgi:hypothetical protein